MQQLDKAFRLLITDDPDEDMLSSNFNVDELISLQYLLLKKIRETSEKTKNDSY